MDDMGDAEGEAWWRRYAAMLSHAEKNTKDAAALVRLCDVPETRQNLKTARENERGLRCAMFHQPLRAFCERCR